MTPLTVMESLLEVQRIGRHHLAQKGARLGCRASNRGIAISDGSRGRSCRGSWDRRKSWIVGSTSGTNGRKTSKGFERVGVDIVGNGYGYDRWDQSLGIRSWDT